MDTSKIIKGVVNSGRYTVTAPIVKEDYGLYLKIEGVELPETYQVDFSNSENSGTSVTMIGNSDGVLIPSQFISTGKDIFAFLYHVGVDFGRTVYKFRIPNKVRPDRTDETPTPEEQSTIDQAINALNTAVEQTAQDVIDADASAQSASQSAENAHDSAVDAQNYAETAQTSATQASASASQASASATASAQSASQSAQIKADVEDLADDAQGYAQASAQSASASANSASQAQGYAQSASASAQSASGYASNAQTSANTASAKAQDASTSAQTASNKASEASQSASQALSYKTDAESAKTASQTAQGLAEQARDTAVSAKTDAESAKADAESARDEAQQAVASISGALADKADVITDTASGAVASFSDGADDLPLKSLVVDINPVQDLHGQDAPYPAGGGKNLAYLEQGSLDFAVDGSEIPSSSRVRTNFIPIELATDYIASAESNGWVIKNGCGYDANKNYLGYGIYPYPGTRKLNTNNFTFSWIPQVKFVRFIYGNATNTDCTPSDYWYQVELGSTATAYAPYENICPISGWTEVNVNHSDADMTNPTTLTIQLGQTVYGGKLDVLSGELVIDRAMVDLGTLDWTGEDSYLQGMARAATVGVAGLGAVYFQTPLCSTLKGTSPKSYSLVEMGTVCFSNSPSTPFVRVRSQIFSGLSDAEIKTALTGVQFVYELATPLEIQLTPQQVNSLLGVNNIWADSGDTTAEYRADTKLFIERLTAPDSADMIADANITSGQYFMVGNTLYKATANIANGGQITVGTNCTRVSLAQALNEINA